MTTHRRVRTFHGRHGRMTERQRDAMGRLASRYALDRRDPDRPLVVEVGCGSGEAAVAFGAAHPDVDVVAVDVHTPGVATLLDTVETEGIDNVYVERADAVDLLDERIAPASLKAVHVFFPDPWPKVRHHKRRFIRPDLLDLCADRLAPDGQLLFATDVDDYGEWSRRHLEDHPAFTITSTDRPAWRPVTRYEHQARTAGRSVIELTARRVARPATTPDSRPTDAPS